MYNLKIDINSKILKFVSLIGVFYSLVGTISAFNTFYEKIDTIGTAKEWKFYASLTAFVIFLSMLILSILLLSITILTKVILKRKK